MKNLINQVLKIDNKADLDLIVSAVKMARAHINTDIIAEAKAFFKIGDTVSFTCRTRGVMTGEITKMKIKNFERKNDNFRRKYQNFRIFF